MDNVIIGLFLVSLSFDIYVVLKLSKRKELNAIDIYSLFVSLYYLLIPIRLVYKDISYRNVPVLEILNDSQDVLVVLCLFKLLLLLLNVIVTKSKKMSFLKITEQFKRFDKIIVINPRAIYLYLAVFLFFLLSITNYSSLSADNFEGDRTWQYAENASFLERIIINMVSVGFPVFFILSMKYLIEIKDRKYRTLAKWNMAVALIGILLGSRTQLFLVLGVSMIYLYSLYRDKITKKTVFYTIIVLITVPTVVFSVSQSFRMSKQYVIENHSSHSFMDVASYFIGMNDRERKMLLEDASNNTDSRSLNVYYAFYESLENDYEKTGGGFFLSQLACLIPIIKPDPKFANFCAELLERGGDIGESSITVFNVDLGLFGVFLITPVYYLILFGMMTFMCTKARYIFNCKELYFFMLAFILGHCISIEAVPSFRSLYNPTIITIVMFGVVFRLFNNRINRLS